MSNITQAGAFLPLLRERDASLKALALEALLKVVDQEWSEISGSLEYIKNLRNDQSLPEPTLAAYLSSKVYYHLGDRDEALNLALESGRFFDMGQRSQYTECLMWHCIDQYVAFQDSERALAFPANKERMIVEVITTSCKNGNQIAALGVSFDCRRVDMVELIINQISVQQLPQVLQLAYNIRKGEFRDSVMQLCVKTMIANNKKLQFDEWANFVSVLVQLNQVVRVAEILWELIQGDDFILAYQIAIDLAENGRPQFINQLVSSLPVQEALHEKRQKLILILTGELQRKAVLYFLKEHKQTDQAILSSIMAATDPKQSVPHGAALMAHAIMQTGTQDASFLRSNIDWATKCNYWLRFTTTATIGMIYKGCHERSNEVLASYLPGGQGSSNVFENGGALFALGLINQGNRSADVIQRLNDVIRNPSMAKNEQVLHGAGLGLGLVNFASEDEKSTDLLRELLVKMQTIYGEAAALGIGLIHAGSGNLDLAKELLALSRQCDKEKIIRQLGTAIAAIVFGIEGRADDMIDQMLGDTESYIRYGGCLALAMAYAGTASNTVIQKLLSYAVNDVADEVRRVAVISLAFVLFRNYEQVPKVMRLLILSYNPHIRYGTALALGIACAGTMYQEALNMLEPMLTDNVDYVRQAALISMSLVMMQATTQCEPKLVTFKKTIADLQSNKYQTNLVKLGIYLSQGILDAGGRNLVVQLASKQGFPKLDACIGMMLFTHYWFWFPFMPFFSLCLSPAAIIALNEKYLDHIDFSLAIPKKFQFVSNSKPSLYGYPTHIKPDEKKVTEKKTVQLSTTNRVRARQSRRDAERQGMADSSVLSLGQGQSQMSLEQQPSQQGLNRHHSSLINTQDDLTKMKVEEPIKKEEPTTTTLSNPARVLDKQKKVISFLTEQQRYEPIFKDRKQGLIMLVDRQPGDADDCAELFPRPKPQQAPASQVHPAPARAYQVLENEVQPPEDFEFDPAAQQNQPK